MTNVAIFGGKDSKAMSDILSGIYGSYQKKPFVSCLVEDDNTENIFDIIVVDTMGFGVDSVNLQSKFAGLKFSDEAVFIVNSDEKNIFKHLWGKNGKIITYGFNSKACVTASSVVDKEFNTIQYCIQRRLPTFQGSIIDEQEFSVNVKSEYRNVNGVLAAVTAALIDDVPVGMITQGCI